AGVLDEIGDEAELEGVELVRAVRGVAEGNDAGVADEGEERAEVALVRGRLRRPQRQRVLREPELRRRIGRRDDGAVPEGDSEKERGDHVELGAPASRRLAVRRLASPGRRRDAAGPAAGTAA